MKRAYVFAALAVFVFLSSDFAFAARIGELTDSSILVQIKRFFSFADPSLRYTVIGSALLGLSCGLIGTFIVVRRMSLMGDALSHAVLPGVAVGFLWTASKDPVAIFVGATAAGLLGSATVHGLTRFAGMKEDAAIGMVLATYFALGITLITMIQRLPLAGKAGINHFLFGQAAALSHGDIIFMAVISAAAISVIYLLYKELLAVSFDPIFAQGIGYPVALLHNLIMFLLAVSVVVALQAVGVVLVSAMLVTPAAAAYLLTKRLKSMLLVSAALGIFSGVIGAFLSFLGPSLPTGPFMVVGASFVFGLVFMFAPKHGVITKWWKLRTLVLRTRLENTLKAIYHVRENNNFEPVVTLEDLAAKRNIDLDKAMAEVLNLQRLNLVSLSSGRQQITLKPEGWSRACQIVRNHRLWELYLNVQKQVPADQVHEEAEEIEHVLGEEIVRTLEKQLKNPHLDPHGRPIPSLEDIWEGLRPVEETAEDYTGKARWKS